MLDPRFSAFRVLLNTTLKYQFVWEKKSSHMKKIKKFIGITDEDITSKFSKSQKERRFPED